MTEKEKLVKELDKKCPFIGKSDRRWIADYVIADRKRIKEITDRQVNSSITWHNLEIRRIVEPLIKFNDFMNYTGRIGSEVSTLLEDAGRAIDETLKLSGVGE